MVRSRASVLLLITGACATTTSRRPQAYQTFEDDPVLPDVVVPGTRITVTTDFQSCVTRGGKDGHTSQTDCDFVGYTSKMICDHPACVVETIADDRKIYGKDYQVTLAQPGTYPMRVEFATGITETVKLKTLVAAYPTKVDVWSCQPVEAGTEGRFRVSIGSVELRKPRDVTVRTSTGEPCTVEPFLGSFTCPGVVEHVTVSMPGYTRDLDCRR